MAKGIRKSVQQIVNTNSIHENYYTIIKQDLTKKHISEKISGEGTSLVIIDVGGSPWSIQLIRGDGSIGDRFDSIYLSSGSRIDLQFRGILFSNIASIPGVNPAVFLVGREI